MVKFHMVSLSEATHVFLHETISNGTAPARVTRRARILLKADEGPQGPGWADSAIAEAVEVSVPTVERVRKRAAAEGAEAALQDRPRWENRCGKVQGEHKARLTALECSDPPAGRQRWTLHLLASTFGEQEGGMALSHETVRQLLKKNKLSRT